MPKKKKVKQGIVVFCELRRPPEEIINISSQNGAEGVVTRKLPKSHVSHVILNANVSEERFLDMKVNIGDRMKKKSMDGHDHFMNTFVKRLERKQQRWMKEDNHVKKNIAVMTPRKKPAASNAGTMSTEPSDVTMYKTAKYPYVGVSLDTAKSMEQNRRDPTKTTLPRIVKTVPAGQLRHPSLPLPPQTPKDQTVKFPKDDILPSPTRQPPWTSMPSYKRSDSVSTVGTRYTQRARTTKPSTRNYDSRFNHLMTWLSPINAMEGPTYRQKMAFA